MEKQTNDQQRIEDKESLWEPLSNWEWEEKEEEYEMALQQVEFFEMQSGPILYFYHEGIKSTIWRDQQGNLQESKEPMSPEQKKNIDEAYETVRAFEALKAKDLADRERYAEACQAEQERQENLLDIGNGPGELDEIRDSEKAIDAVTVNDTLTDEQVQYIIEVEERAGIEFNNYEEAVAWEQNEYGEADLSLDSVSSDETSGLSNVEMLAVQEMSDIRQATHEPGHSRIADFEQHEFEEYENNTPNISKEGINKEDDSLEIER